MTRSDGQSSRTNRVSNQEEPRSRPASRRSDWKLLVGCEHCNAVIPVIVRETGEIDPIGTGGVCRRGSHTFTIRGQTLSPP